MRHLVGLSLNANFRHGGGKDYRCEGSCLPFVADSRVLVVPILSLIVRNESGQVSEPKWAVRYEPGDCIILLKDHCTGDKQIAAGESGIVGRLVSSDDRRLAHSLYIDIQLDGGAEQIRVIPSEVKPAPTSPYAVGWTS